MARQKWYVEVGGVDQHGSALGLARLAEDGDIRCKVEASPISVPSPPYDDFPSPYVGPMAVGDFKKLDLATANLSDGTVSILLQQ